MFKLLNRISPSFRLENDPITYDDSKTVKPISVSRLRVTPFIKRRICALRKKINVSFKFIANKRLTVVIPFRDREDHLKKLIPILVESLSKQSINYSILVVEQAEDSLFNRGYLKNIGAHYSSKNTDYYVFHDVDALPVHADYRCPSNPLRLVKKFTSTWRMKEALDGTNFGGVVSFLKHDFESVNGYSNQYWGWGKEDDDIFIRMILKGLAPFEDTSGVFSELINPNHQLRSNASIIRKNKQKKSRMLRGLEQFENDGLNSLHYKIIDEQDYDDYKKIKVSI